MKIKALSLEELHVLSSILEGALFQLSMCKSIASCKAMQLCIMKNDNFIITNINRFMWEEASNQEYKRTYSNITFNNVASIIVPKINKRHFLFILGIIPVDNDHLRIYCTNLITIEIYLKSPEIEIYLEDFHQQWSTNTPPILTKG